MKKSLFTLLSVVCILGVLVAGCSLGNNNGATGNVVGPTNNPEPANYENQTAPPTNEQNTGSNVSNNITLTQNNPAPSTTNQRETSFAADLNGKQETPATPSTATGYVTATLNGNTLTLTGNFEGLISDATASHIHYGGVSYPGPAVFSITINEMAANSSSSSNETVGGPQQFSTNGTLSFTGTLTDSQIIQLTNGFFYVNVHSTQFPNGEIRGQLLPEGTPGISTSMATTQNSSATVTSNGTMGTSTGSTSTTTGSGGTTSGTGSSGGSY